MGTSALAKGKKAPARRPTNHCEFTEADRAPFFEMARRFSQRLKQEPELVTDAEIREVLGEDIAPTKVRNFVGRKSAAANPKALAGGDLSTKSPKPEGSVAAVGPKAKATEQGKLLRKKANRALHTRLFALGRILDEVDAAISGVISAPGKTRQLQELQAMRQSLDAFRTAVGWARDPVEPLPPIDTEIFRDLLLDPTWPPDDA